MKAFKVTGEINKPRLNTSFVRELLADKSEHAVEKVYAENSFCEGIVSRQK